MDYWSLTAVSKVSASFAKAQWQSGNDTRKISTSLHAGHVTPDQIAPMLGLCSSTVRDRLGRKGQAKHYGAFKNEHGHWSVPILGAILMISEHYS